MTTFEIEMAALISVLVVGIVVFIVVHRKLLGAVYDRQMALDGYVKAVTRDKLVVIREAQQAVDKAQHMRDEARQVLDQLQQHLSDPEVKRLLGRLP